MASRADTFYPSTTDQDFTASGEVDIRKLVESIGGADDTTEAAFGTGTAEIVLDPYTTRSTTGTTDAPNLGWALNRDGSDGMAVPTPPAGVDAAERFIAAGTWTFNGRLGSALATTGTYRMRVRVYKVDSAGARTLLFGPINSAGVSPTTAGSSVSATSDEPEHTFDEDETLLVSYSIEKTGGSVGSETIEFRLNDTLGNDCEIVLPAGIRTRYVEERQVSAVGTSTLDPLAAGIPRTVSGVGTATMSRVTTAARTVTVSAVGTVSRTSRVDLTATVTAVGNVTGRIQVPLDEIPDDGDFSGDDPTATVSGRVFNPAGGVAVGATVLLFRQSDNLFIASTITDAAGDYSFVRDTADPNEYYIVAYTSDTAHGSSNRSLTPEA